MLMSLTQTAMPALSASLLEPFGLELSTCFQKKFQLKCKYVIFANMLKFAQKSRKLPDIEAIFNIFAKSFSALKFKI